MKNSLFQHYFFLFTFCFSFLFSCGDNWNNPCDPTSKNYSATECAMKQNPNAPSAPSGLTATVVSSMQVNLSWTDNSNNEFGFKIERKTGAGGTYAQAGTVGVGVTDYQDFGLTCETNYYYRVRANNSTGDSDYSNEANTTTSACPLFAPQAPSSLQATAVSASQVNLIWTDNSNNEDGFKIERKTGSGGTYLLISTTSANVASYSDTGLSAGTTYYYRVYAYNSAGNSGYSNEMSAIPGLWTPTSTGANVPTERFSHTAVWTGTEMIVWGGGSFASGPLYAFNTGGKYNPSTDSWTPTSTGANVPIGKSYHTAVWTGTEMIVWGGLGSADFLNTGGVYTPSTDSWNLTSTGTNVPTRRMEHTAIWTGTEMIIWGGYDGNNDLYTGGRYNPLTDSWTATSTGTNVPSARIGHVAVWTGTEMIVWGGAGNTGGRYNPLTNSWTAIATGGNAPGGENHTAVWTGTEMIVWGGSSGNTGGRYNPSTNSWTPTSTGANVPTGRSYHTAVWTGTEMIVWGGFNSDVTNTGGIYNPSTDSWTPTSIGTNVPTARNLHTAVWTGTEMIVWGGSEKNYANPFNTGGIYIP